MLDRAERRGIAGQCQPCRLPTPLAGRDVGLHSAPLLIETSSVQIVGYVSSTPGKGRDRTGVTNLSLVPAQHGGYLFWPLARSVAFIREADTAVLVSRGNVGCGLGQPGGRRGVREQRPGEKAPNDVHRRSSSWSAEPSAESWQRKMALDPHRRLRSRQVSILILSPPASRQD